MSSAGTQVPGAWVNDGTRTAVFAAGTTATAAYSVTLEAGQSISVNRLRFEEGTVSLVPGGGATLTMTGSDLEVAGGLSASIVQGISGSAGLATVSAGTLALSGANTYSGMTAVRNGALVLNFSNAAAPASDIVPVSSPLVLGGSMGGLPTPADKLLTVMSRSIGASSQSFNGTTLEGGMGVIRATSTGSGSVSLSLGAISRTSQGIANFILPASGAITTSNTNTNGILGGWATVGTGQTSFNGLVMGTDWAAVDATGKIVAYTGYTDATTGVLHGSVTPQTNLRINSGTAQVNVDGAGTVTDLNSIKGGSLRIGAGNTLRLGARGGVLRSSMSSFDEQIGTTQNVGTLTAGGAADQPGEIVFTVNNVSQSQGTLLVDVGVVDNGAGAVTVVKNGPGSMKFRGHNTYSGGTHIVQGRFQVAGADTGTVNPDAFGTGPVYIRKGGQAYLSDVGPVGPTNDFYIAGSGTLGEPLGAIRLGGRSGTGIAGKITLLDKSRLGGWGTFSGQITGPYGLELGPDNAAADIDLTFSNTANDWSGDTMVLMNKVPVADPTHSRIALGASNVIPDGPGKGNLIFSKGGEGNSSILFDMAGFSETLNGLSTLLNGGISITIENSKPGTLSMLTVGNNDASGNFAGALRDGAGTLGLTKIGSGTLSLISSYTGPTVVSGGLLKGGSSNSSSVTVASGGAVENLFVSCPLTFAGAGPDGNGALIAVNGFIASGAVTMAGDATVRCFGTMAFSGSITPNGYTLTKRGVSPLRVNNLRDAGLVINEGTVGVVPNGMSAGASHLKSLSILNGAALDLADNDLVVNYGGSSSFWQIFDWVISGFSPMPAANTGIVSSTSQAGGGLTILALFDNALVGATEWNGLSVPVNCVIGKYTYFGDANLDGQVSGDDYTVIDANLGTTPAVGLGWLSGDANLDGLVTGDDYTVVDANLGLGEGNPLAGASAGLSSVPEPWVGGLIGGAMMMLQRRRPPRRGG